MWCALALTKHGKIPGKAQPGKGCWYSYAGFEYLTQEFLVLSKLAAQGCENGKEELWCGVATSRWGKIPGKITKQNVCVYSYGGCQYETSDFVKIKHQVLVKTLSGQPPQGRQTDGAGDQWCAVANTSVGKIPGKAQNGTCWYALNGKENTTSDFWYVVEAEKDFSSKSVVDLPAKVVHNSYNDDYDYDEEMEEEE